MTTAPQLPVTPFDSIDSFLLSGITGGAGENAQGGNFLQQWGRNMQSGGEYAMAAGAVGISTSRPSSVASVRSTAAPRLWWLPDLGLAT